MPAPHSNDWLYHPRFPSHWESGSLYEMAGWTNGLAFRNIQFSAIGKPVIKIAEIKGGITRETKFTEQVFHESVHVRSGDMLFSWSGQPETSIDVFWWRGPDGWLNQHTFLVTPAAGIHRTFFYYLLRYLKPHFVAIARNKQTTGLGHVTKGDLQRILAALPPLPEQRAIASILGALDDKIELNRKMNETLEQMARAIFKSWFVDFDPVRRNIARRAGETIDLSAGASAEVDALFPDSFEDSELGPIPKGWRVGDVYSISRVLYGAPFASNLFNTSGTGRPLLRIRDLATHDPTVFTSEEHPRGTQVMPGDIVVGMDGEFRVHLWHGPVSWLNQRVCTFKPLPCIPRAFVLFAIEEPFAFFERSKTGTTVIHVGKADIDTFRTLVPPQPALKAFGRCTEPLLSALVGHAGMSRTLAQIRDALLPKLISGEIRVGNI